MEYMTAAQLEEEKQNLINREIERFRCAYEQRDRARDSERGDVDRDRERDRNGSRDRDRDRNGSRDRDRDRNGSRDRDSDRNGYRNRDRERDRSSERDRERSRRPSDRPNRRAESSGPSSRDRHERDSRRIQRPPDPNLHARDEQEMRRLERKELSYQNRLREWQRRERKKREQYEAQLARDREKRLFEQQESRRLKIFLEDYRDDRDDVRYYMGSALAQRLAERRKEIEIDEFETKRELAELEKLSAKCNAEKTTLADEHIDSQANSSKTLVDAKPTSTVTETQHNSSQADESNCHAVSVPTTTASSTSSTSNSKPTSATDKRSRIKKQIEELINSIPTTRDDLFNYKFDWSYLDEHLMHHRIRPWVTKKVTEYIGEADETFIEFICARLQAHNDGPNILREVAAVLDDEAEEFVVKMWRLLIYEIEAKKLGISKAGSDSAGK